MRNRIALIMAVYFLSSYAAEAEPISAGAVTVPPQGSLSHATEQWAKARPKLTTAQTANVPHSCNKDLHTTHCVKKCVIKATEVQAKGLPPIWHVRGGTAFPLRDYQAEAAMLGQIYPAKLTHKREVQGTIVK